MLYRISALIVFSFWAAMMSWLLYHDVWPAWKAEDPPRVRFEDSAALGDSQSQVGIFDGHGNRVGTAWTSSSRLGTAVSREDLIWINRFPGLPPTRIEIDSTLGPDGNLEQVQMRVSGHDVGITLQGERFAQQFAFRLTAGTRDLKFKIPEAQAGMMGQMFRPFTRLGDLRVGQSWLMQVFNPFAAVSGFGSPFEPMLARVTGTRTLAREGVNLECFMVETPGSQALVGPDGMVYEQRVQLPVGGVIHIRDEPYDEEERSRAAAIRLPPVEDPSHGN